MWYNGQSAEFGSNRSWLKSHLNCVALGKPLICLSLFPILIGICYHTLLTQEYTYTRVHFYVHLVACADQDGVGKCTTNRSLASKLEDSTGIQYPITPLDRNTPSFRTVSQTNAMCISLKKLSWTFAFLSPCTNNVHTLGNGMSRPTCMCVNMFGQ